MRRATTASHPPRAAWLGAVPHMGRGVARWAWQTAVALCLTWALGVAHNARAQGVELATLELRPAEGALTLEFSARLTLARERSKTPCAAACRCTSKSKPPCTAPAGTGVTSACRASRAATALSYQPLTGTWRVGLGALRPELSDPVRGAGGDLAQSAAGSWPKRAQLDNGSALLRGVQLSARRLAAAAAAADRPGHHDWSLGISRALQRR